MTQPDKTKDENVAALLVGDLQRTIDFLKYAEAKNGALLTFASAWVLAIININITLGDKSTHLYEYSVLPPFILAGTAALVSFFPRINLPRFLGGRRAGPHPKNLLYFGDVGAMTVSEFEKAIHDNYYPPGDRTVADAYLHDLIVQVAVNSQITKRKLQLFQIGMWLYSNRGYNLPRHNRDNILSVSSVSVMNLVTPDDLSVYKTCSFIPDGSSGIKIRCWCRSDVKTPKPA